MREGEPNEARGPARSRLLHAAAAALAGLIVLRLAIGGWWLAADHRVPDIESARHLGMAWDMADVMGRGDLLWGFEAGQLYPPLHHLIGAAGYGLFGWAPDGALLAQALVLIPAFAIAVYGAASIAYGRTAGVIAAAIALTAPMVFSAFHMFLIDTPQAVAAALCVWLVLASRRFERVGVAALAGVAGGLGMLAKQNFPMFVLGVVLVALARGGWRHWKGFGAFLLAGALVSITWYWSELDRTFGLIQGGSLDQPATEAAGDIRPSRWTTKNIGWYVWSTLNNHLLLPLTLAFVGGAIALSIRWIRRRRPDDVTPELVAGGLVAFAGLTWISLKDPRYALPATVYMAVLAAGGVTLLRGAWRTVALAAIGLVCALNVFGAVAGEGRAVAIRFPGAPSSGIGERELTLYKPGGWVTGRPYDDRELVAMMRAAYADGARRIDFDPGAQEGTFNQGGLDLLRRMTGLQRGSVFAPDWGARGDIFMTGHWPGQDQVTVEPCARLEGTGLRVYLTHDDPKRPFETWRDFYCPLR